MNILYIGYWNLMDPLTRATIFPGLRILKKLQPDSDIVFVNVQREVLPERLPPIFEELGIIYYPFFSKEGLLTKIKDYLIIPSTINKLYVKHNITKTVAQGTNAGALAYLAWKKSKIHFLVGSFEPHSDYMNESKVWRKSGLRYFFLKHWENKQKQAATVLVPVAENYKKQLLKEGVAEEKIKVVPNGVDERLFLYNESERKHMREKLGIPADALAGVYAGRYGGLYLAEKSFLLYKAFFQWLPNFYLILLALEEYHSWIHQQIAENELPLQRVFVKYVNHNEVGGFYSASDFAFATYSPGKSKAHQSPVKVGEYWLNGLPVLMTRGIGDESGMIERGFGGVLFEPENINEDSVYEMIAQLRKFINAPRTRTGISEHARQFRSFEKLRKAFEYFLRS